MLLTVIAVATLLVAVVGATFAYFSLSLTNNTSTTNVAAETGKLATLTLNKGAADLKMKLTGTEMSKGNEKKYYAVSDVSSNTKDTGAYYSESEQKVSIGSLSVTGAEKEVYNCKVTITITDSDSDMITSLTGHENEAILTLEGPNVGGTSVNSKKIDLANFAEEYTEAISIDTTLDATNTSRAYTASLMVENTSEDQTTYLSSKSLSLSIKTDASCEVADSAAAAD